MKNTVKFKELEVGDKFTCYGDRHLNYNFPKICKCHKVDENTGKEFDDIRFLMNDSDEVFQGRD